MAKRFIDTEFFRDTFVKSLDQQGKLIFLYLITNCDHAGVWEKDIEVLEIRIAGKVDEDELKKTFKGQLIFEDERGFWFLPGFIKYQYKGVLNLRVKTHQSAYDILKKKNLLKYVKTMIEIKGLGKGLGKGLANPLVRDKDKDKDKDIYNNINIINNKTKKDLSNTKQGKPKKATKKKSVEKPEVFYSAEARKLAEIFFRSSSDLIQKKVTENPSMQKSWMKSFEDLLKKKSYSFETIKMVVLHFRADSFWSENFLSPAKLLRKTPDKITYIDFFIEKMSHKTERIKNANIQSVDDFENSETYKALYGDR